MATAIEAAFQVHRQYGVEVFLGHLHHRSVTHDAGVVDQDVDTAEVVDGALDDALRSAEIGDRIVIRNRLAAELLNFFDYLCGRIFFSATPVDAAADIVDHHLRPFARQGESDATANTATR